MTHESEDLQERINTRAIRMSTELGISLDEARRRVKAAMRRMVLVNPKPSIDIERLSRMCRASDYSRERPRNRHGKNYLANTFGKAKGKRKR